MLTFPQVRNSLIDYSKAPRARRRVRLVRVLKHSLQRNPENPGDLEGDL
jgi:hypothetical protein